MSQLVTASEENLAKLAKLLVQGEVVAFPTETVYGLGADASNPEAVAKIYAIKNRPSFNPLISHYSSGDKAWIDVIPSKLAYKLAEKFWPGPLTMILPKSKNSRISSLATAGLDCAAVRVPVHPVAMRLLEKLDIPVVAPSANPSTKLSPVSTEHVMKSLGSKLDWVLDGGECSIGIESTVIDLTTESPVILRAGVITEEEITAVILSELGGRRHCEERSNPVLLKTGSLRPLAPQDGNSLKSPGMMEKHYAPNVKLRLSINDPQPNEALLAFGSENIPQGFSFVKNLSAEGSLQEAASNLFKYLHELDAMNVSGIAVMPIPNEGIGIAINDRLRRAAM